MKRKTLFKHRHSFSFFSVGMLKIMTNKKKKKEGEPFFLRYSFLAVKIKKATDCRTCTLFGGLVLYIYVYNWLGGGIFSKRR